MIAVVELEVRAAAGERTLPTSLVRLAPRGPSAELWAIRVSHRGGEDRLRRLRGYRPSTVRQMVQAQLALAATLAPVRAGEARVHLQRAATLAVENGLLTALRGAPEPLVLLAETLGADGSSASVAALLQHVEPASAPASAPVTAPSVRLSAGEVELLEVMGTVRGQAELAEVLGVSVNTVKTRLRRLYRKLDVSSRDAALAAAEAVRVGAGDTSTELVGRQAMPVEKGR